MDKILITSSKDQSTITIFYIPVDKDMLRH